MADALLRRLLAHPLTASVGLDEAATTELRKQIIASKPFLRAVYDEWYRMLAREVPEGDGEVLELGSGAGYCERFIPGLITSEVFQCEGIKVVADAQRMPFAQGSLRAIVMTNVMHHMPDVTQFLVEAARCVREGGKILMIEPWITPWSRFVYTRLHHEPCESDVKRWGFASTGPLSGANSALPWIVFVRDREQFETRFPKLAIEKVRPFMPFRYLLSGGVGLRSLMPGFLHAAWAGMERLLEPLMERVGMFAFVSLKRV